MKKVVFIKDFATKKKGDNWECDSMLASQLVNVDKVAEYASSSDLEEKKQTKKRVKKA